MMIKYKMYQNWFCKQFVERASTLNNFESYLKYILKKDLCRSSITSASIYDVLNNVGVNKLVRRLYKLKKKKEYEVDISYLKRPFKQVNYINSNFNGIETGLIAGVKLKKDKWISKIEIRYTYINNSEMVIEYYFRFKKSISTYVQIHEFVMENILRVKKGEYFHCYADKSIIKKADYKEILKLDDIFFADILQAYVYGLFYTVLGDRYKLPIEYSMKLYHKNSKVLRKVPLMKCFERNNEYLIVGDYNYDRFEAMYFWNSKNYRTPFLLEYFSYLSTEMYYTAFYKIEIIELEQHMRKYLNSRKKFVSPKDMKWLINKIRYIQDKEKIISSVCKEGTDCYMEDLFGWSLYISGKRRCEDFINYPTNTKYFKEIYQRNLKYLTDIATVQNDNIVLIVTVLTLIATIIGILVTIISN